MISKKRGVTLVILVLFLLVLSLSVFALEEADGVPELGIYTSEQQIGDCNIKSGDSDHYVTIKTISNADCYPLEAYGCPVRAEQKNPTKENTKWCVYIEDGVIVTQLSPNSNLFNDNIVSGSGSLPGCTYRIQPRTDDDFQLLCSGGWSWSVCDEDGADEGVVAWLSDGTMFECYIKEEIGDAPAWREVAGKDRDKDGYTDDTLVGNDCEDEPITTNLESPSNCPETPSECNWQTSRCAICINPGMPEICGDGLDNDCNPDTSDNCHENADACRGGLGDDAGAKGEEDETCTEATVDTDCTTKDNGVCESGTCVYKDEDGKVLPPDEKPLTPDNILHQSLSWIPTDDPEGGRCCGFEGIDDLGITRKGVKENEKSNFVCLNKKKHLVGYDGDFPSANCEGSIGWCWVNANGLDSEFKVFTIKKPDTFEIPNPPTYDIVSDSVEWQECTSLNPGPLQPSNSVLKTDIAKRFYCYQEGQHFSWAECFGGLDPYNDNIKSRYSGDGLYNLYLTDALTPNDLGEKIISGQQIYIEADKIPYSNFYSTATDHSFDFDFSGYDQLEFFVRFTDSEKNVLTSDTLVLPVGINLTLSGPNDENGEPIIYFEKNVLGNVASNIQFGKDNWLHIKVPIPDNLKAVSLLRFIPIPTANYLMIKNVYLSKSSGLPPQICSGKDDIIKGSWLDSFDDGSYNSGVNAKEMCESHYGKNAWLGDDKVVTDSSANCCGNGDINGDPEYYSGESEPFSQSIDNPGIKYGCWNNQPVANEQTIMNVEFEVDYSIKKEITVKYIPQEYRSKLYVSGYKIKCDDDFGTPIQSSSSSNWCGDISAYDYCLGQNDVESCLGLETKYKDYSNLYCYEPNYWHRLSKWRVTDKLCSAPYSCKWGNDATEVVTVKSCMSSTLEEFEYKSLEAGLPYPENKKDLSTTFKSPTIINHLIYDESGVITYSQTNDYLTYADVYSGISNTYKVSEFVINNAANAVAEAYFYHPVEGYLGTKITIKELKELEEVDIYAKTDAINTVKKPITQALTETFIYPCNASECLYPLPGIPEQGITVTNPNPDLYELYFVTNENGDYKETLISGTGTIFQPANLLAKKVAQQVVFLSPFSEDELVNPDFYAEDPEIGFYGCQAASFIEDQLDLNSDTVLTTNEPYCSVKEDFFCAPSVTLGTKDKYTAINSWSTEILTKIGYEEPVKSDINEIETFFEQLDLKLKEGEEKPSKERNFTAVVLPARNFIPNAEFQVKGGKLSYWEVFDGLDVEDTEKEVFVKKIIDIPAGKTLKTERIAIPEDENLQFSYSGTATATITLVDKDGTPTPVTNTFSTNKNSYLTIEFTAGTVEEPLLQLVDSSGPITDYSYTPTDEIERSGLACCPQDYCWNGYACIEPMNLFDIYTQISEHIDDRNYRCIAGEWKNSPIKWDWNAENWGFCDDNKQCFVTKDGNLESEANFYDNDLLTETTPPICIDNEEYVLDHYCEDGDWSSRTKFLATKLLEVAENNDDYTLYCTNYQDALLLNPESDNPQKLGGGTELTITKESPDPLSPPIEEQIYTCFNTLPDTLFKTEENTCINNVCVLKFDDGAKRAFGTTLNKDIDDPDSFLQTLNIPQEQFETICAGTDDVIKCDLSTTSVEGDLWYIPEINAVIYSKQGIQLDSTIVDTVVDWFKDLFGIDSELSGQNLFVQEAKNFKEIYLLSKDDKKAKVIKEIFPKNKTLVAEFENFQTPVCDYVNAYKPVYSVELLEDLSGVKTLVCTADNTPNIQSIEIAADDDALNFIWPQLTGKLRVEE